MMKSVWRRQCRVKYETEFVGRLARHKGFGGRKGERGVDYFRTRNGRNVYKFEPSPPPSVKVIDDRAH